MRRTLTETGGKSLKACYQQVRLIRPETGEEMNLFGTAPGKRCMASK